MKRIASFFLALAMVFSLTACTVPVEKADDGKIQIVATLFPYYDFARAIAGDRADVTLLLSPGREAHSFEPTPLDAVTISESDVFLYNGGEGVAIVEFPELAGLAEDIPYVWANAPAAERGAAFLADRLRERDHT